MAKLSDFSPVIAPYIFDNNYAKWHKMVSGRKGAVDDWVEVNDIVFEYKAVEIYSYEVDDVIILLPHIKHLKGSEF
jgi:hypothetical protein